MQYKVYSTQANSLAGNESLATGSNVISRYAFIQHKQIV